MIVVERIIGEDLNLGVNDATVTHPGGGTLQGTQISLTTFSRNGPAGGRQLEGLPTDAAVNLQPLGFATYVYPDVRGGANEGDLVLVGLSMQPPVGIGEIPPMPVHIAYGFVSQPDEVTIVIFNPTTEPIVGRFNMWFSVFSTR